MLKHLKEEPSLRVLDIGPTSPNNINFLTGMGHSIYMADIVQEAFESEWALTDQVEEDDLPPDVQAFCDQNLNFHDRRFDVVLLWATIDYLPPSLIPAVIARLHDCMELGGQMLAFFHTRTTSSEAVFYRYHLVDNTSIDMQHNAPYPVLRVYTNREVERLFKNFSGCKFFLARDNVLEVIVTR
ncbi:MAG TPA: methyltransferase domain-containing protein [Acidisarcina sp.]